MTLGTLLRIRANPITRLAIIRALLSPPPHNRAAARSVVGVAAAETEGVGAGALDRGNDGIELAGQDVAFEGVGAVGSGAPAEGGGIVDVGAV